jgi:hypothetical protein
LKNLKKKPLEMLFTSSLIYLIQSSYFFFVVICKLGILIFFLLISQFSCAMKSTEEDNRCIDLFGSDVQSTPKVFILEMKYFG